MVVIEKKGILFLCIIQSLLILSCNRLTLTEKIIRETINKKIYLNFDTIQHNTNRILFEDFRKKYNYISIVYLEDGCNPCYPKFIEWQTKMDSILNISSDYNVLFIIKGNSTDSFFKSIKLINPNLTTSKNFYMIIDNCNTFLRDNPEINRWAIDRTILIDHNNKIKLIGAPFQSKKMMVLFQELCLS